MEAIIGRIPRIDSGDLDPATTVPGKGVEGATRAFTPEEASAASFRPQAPSLHSLSNRIDAHRAILACLMKRQNEDREASEFRLAADDARLKILSKALIPRAFSEFGKIETLTENVASLDTNLAELRKDLDEDVSALIRANNKLLARLAQQDAEIEDLRNVVGIVGRQINVVVHW